MNEIYSILYLFPADTNINDQLFNFSERKLILDYKSSYIMKCNNLFP